MEWTGVVRTLANDLRDAATALDEAAKSGELRKVEKVAEALEDLIRKVSK